MFPGWMQIGLVVLLIVLLFGRGKISELMGDVAKGITSFRKGLKEDDDTPAQIKGDDSLTADVKEAENTSEKSGEKSDA